MYPLFMRHRRLASVPDCDAIGKPNPKRSGVSWLASTMNAERKSLLDWIIGWFASPSASTDHDFDGWIGNDPMVTLNPASRYGDDATGFLGGSELENHELGKTED